jgi:glutamyl-tRNA synthetase/glutamyl-Q tRNA(Asp) synthetase
MDDFKIPLRTRFAPSPTGYLHRGHVLNAIMVWGVARLYGGKIMLRVEDHDRERCRPEYETALLEDLQWLGLEWDEFSRQSDREEIYLEMLDALRMTEHVYHCQCSRKDILENSMQPGGELWYPGTCDNLDLDEKDNGVRVVLPTYSTGFDDSILGEQIQTPALQCGDILLRDRKGNWTYHFACVVDDFLQKINLVIRGEDLLESTGRQMMLHTMLANPNSPKYLHHPLIFEKNGVKMSKRDFSMSIREERSKGINREKLFGEVLYSAGILPAYRPVAVGELLQITEIYLFRILQKKQNLRRK